MPYNNNRYIDKNTGRPKWYTFSMLNIPFGSKISFLEDNGPTCTVKTDRTVEYNGKEYMLYYLAMEIGGKKFRNPLYAFKYNGKFLSDIRDEIEAQNQ